jgi:hypothetical protein
LSSPKIISIGKIQKSQRAGTSYFLPFPIAYEAIITKEKALARALE